MKRTLMFASLLKRDSRAHAPNIKPKPMRIPTKRDLMDWRIYLVFPRHFQLIWISKGEYDEYGPSIVHSSVCELAVCMEIDQSLRFRGLFFVLIC